ncbi:hypothetical protein NLJ89_g9515 [Agrocybe chaxingu]|uniref:Uncharacterized protein n=1 Tax=Agrocybe chaxingu TaxID=84603 RepID=A0A9W8K0F4_9AGAR|nr:hypothetical protein NLJ89_g9515 [Agrocybe chaxingu]
MSTPSKLRTRHSLGLRRSLADTEHESEEEDDYDETEDEDWFTLGINNDTKRHSLQMEMLKGIPASRADLALLLKRVYDKLESQSMEVRDIADNNDEDGENLGPKRR